jgi:MFS family permease
MLLVSLLSTTIEFYCFFVYATAAAVVLGPLFFPSSSTLAQSLGAWGSFALAFVARPMGAVLFGHIGDQGRRDAALAGAMLLMGGCTVAIGLLPTSASIGWLAPLLLCLLRFGQGLGLGGQWGGAVLIAVDDAPAARRGLYAMVPQFGAPLSFMLSNAVFLALGAVLAEHSFTTWGWRIPFLLSAPLMFFAAWVRRSLAKPPSPGPGGDRETRRMPIKELLQHNPLPTLLGTLGVTACFVLYYLATAFALGHAVGTLGFLRQRFLLLQVAAMPFMALGTLAAGRLSDIVGPRLVLLAGAGLTMMIGLLLAPATMGPPLLSAVYLCAGLAVLGLMYGTLGNWLPTLYAAELRYTGPSIAFNVAGVLGGALTPLIASALTERGGLPAVGLYVAGAGLVSSLAVLASGRDRES